MSQHVRTGRVVGALLLIQALLAIPVFTEIGMMNSIIIPEFLQAAAADATKIRAALLLTFVLGGLTLAVALVAMPVFRAASERMFWLYFALATTGLATAALESVVAREMLAMSINYVEPNAATSVYEAWAPVARAQWSAAHFFNLMSGHVKALVFFLILFRFRFVPAWLAGVGILATMGSTAGAALALVGVPFSYFMIGPAGLVQLLLTAWLLWKGFAAPVRNPGPVPSATGP